MCDTDMLGLCLVMGQLYWPWIMGKYGVLVGWWLASECRSAWENLP